MNSSDVMAAIEANLGMVIKGKGEALGVLAAAVAAEGSVLMEDVPGVGKTTLAKTLARSIGAEFKRVQFTPDLLPADILGSSIYNPRSGEFDFRRGPIFCNVLLADEINRASPRTQAALLEAMSEQQATIEGERYTLEPPFLVVATQNPVEFHGTYPLPEAQLDRFMAKISLGYPDRAASLEMLYGQAESNPLKDVKPATSKEDLIELQAKVRAVDVESSVANYLCELAERSRRDERVQLGVSPRGMQHLFRMAQAWAARAGRGYAEPGDVQAMAPVVVAHRLGLTAKARYAGVEKAALVDEWLAEVPVPA